MASTARLDELKKKFDENPRRYFAPLANEHRKSGDLDQAISLCRAHLPQQPAHISGHIVLGQALFEAGQVDESREVFRTALELDPENLIALRYLGDIARHVGDVPTARSWYTRVLEVDPRNDEIAQLVRELDAPLPPAQPADAAMSTLASASQSRAAAAEPAAAPAATEGVPERQVSAADNERFAPLSVDEIDVDGDFFVAAHPTAGTTPSSGPTSDDALEVDEDWTTDSPTSELPMLDAPEHDPFAMPASASAESLFDATTHAADEEDALIRDLSTGGASADLGDLEAAPSVGDVWAMAPEDTHDAAPDQERHGAGERFEEGSFYLETPDGMPTASSFTDMAEAEPEPAGQHAAASETLEAEPPFATMAANDADQAAAAGDRDAAEEPVAAERWGLEASQAEPDRGADAPYSHDTADPVYPAEQPLVLDATSSDANTHDDLGLEVMEFVPPGARAEAAPMDAAAPGSDPLLGRTPELGAAPEGSPPAAFVTETMAELYLQQGFRNEALSVYRELLARNPGDSSLRERIEQIESGSMSSIGIATLSENVVESALKRQAARPARSVRSFFAVLAGRRAPERAPAHDAVADATPAELPAPSGAAAEMATFDPFGAQPPEPRDEPGGDGLPNVTSESPNDEPAPPADPPRSLQDLFPTGAVAPGAESVAETFATAFGRPEPQGRPTRAASNELSLDHVFRGMPEGAPSPDGGFSFDQFFSDARQAPNDVATAPATSSSGGGQGDEGSDSHDIEQFTAWLEGLKKK